jgi:hypothetical protein
VGSNVTAEGEDGGEVYLDDLLQSRSAVAPIPLPDSQRRERTSFQSLSGNSALGWRRWIPAQFTRMWILCPSFRIAGVRAATSAWEDRSAV